RKVFHRAREYISSGVKATPACMRRTTPASRTIRLGGLPNPFRPGTSVSLLTPVEAGQGGKVIMGLTKLRNRGGKRMNVRHSQVLMAILVLTAMAVLGPQPAWAMHSVAITAGPEGTISTTDARLTFTSTEPATLACMLDGANPVPCGGPGAT